MYLDQLSNSTDPYFATNNYQKERAYANHEDQEDLSMVSDASSGPPPNDYYGYANSVPVPEGKKKNKQKNKAKEAKSCKKQQNLCLDDTASSPAYDFSQVSPLKHENRSLFRFFTRFL